MIYPPNCENIPIPYPDIYCAGYKKEKLLKEDGCPCLNQNGKERKDMKMPPCKIPDGIKD